MCAAAGQNAIGTYIYDGGKFNVIGINGIRDIYVYLANG